MIDLELELDVPYSLSNHDKAPYTKRIPMSTLKSLFTLTVFDNVPLGISSVFIIMYISLCNSISFPNNVSLINLIPHCSLTKRLPASGTDDAGLRFFQLSNTAEMEILLTSGMTKHFTIHGVFFLAYHTAGLDNDCHD